MNIRVKRSPDIIYNKIGEDIVILGRSGEELITLNSTAAIIWELCDGEENENDIVNILYGQFSADYETIRCDVHEIISMLQNKGLLEPLNNPDIHTNQR